MTSTVWVVVQHNGSYSSQDWNVLGIVNGTKEQALERTRQALIDYINIIWYERNKGLFSWDSKEDLQRTIDFIEINNNGLGWLLNGGNKDKIPNFYYRVEECEMYMVEMEIDGLLAPISI